MFENRGWWGPDRGIESGHSGRLYKNKEHARAAAVTGGIKACEACGWRAPPFLREWRGSEITLLHLHHIVPVEAGGQHWENNLTLLCQNCHRVAHGIWPVAKDGYYLGPVGRRTFLAHMRVVVQDPDFWRSHMKPQIGGRVRYDDGRESG